VATVEVALVFMAFLFMVTSVLAYEEGKIVASETSYPSDPESKATVDDEWLRAWYAAAHSDIRWDKERSWIVVRWAVVMYPALVGAYVKRLFGQLGSEYFALLTVAFALWGGYYLIHLHRFAASTRATAKRILETVSGHSRFLPSPRRDQNHLLFLAVQLVLLTAIAIATIFALVTLGQGSSN
jgi:hypothetical protein